MKSICNDPGIICFKHCKSKIFASGLLSKCPECQMMLNSNDRFALMPFRLPYPFVKPHQYPCSIILRPTHGDFLNDYINAMNLHIAVTMSDGAIIEFDHNGLKKTTKHQMTSQSHWIQSLVVETIPEPWYDHWDNVLNDMDAIKHTKWTSNEYNEDSFNCYTFVLEFLRRLNYGTLSAAAKNRTTFCEHYIIPRTTAAGKYISLYRKIRDHGFYIHSSSMALRE